MLWNLCLLGERRAPTGVSRLEPLLCNPQPLLPLTIRNGGGGCHKTQLPDTPGGGRVTEGKNAAWPPGPWPTGRVTETKASPMLRPPTGLWAPPKPLVASEGPQCCFLCSWLPRGSAVLVTVLVERQGDRSGFMLGLLPQESKVLTSVLCCSPTELSSESARPQQPPHPGAPWQGSKPKVGRNFVLVTVQI